MHPLTLRRPFQPPLLPPQIPTLPHASYPTTSHRLRLRRRSSPRRLPVPARCASSGEGGEGEQEGELRPRAAEEAVAGMLGEGVEELLRRDENRPLLRGLEAASRRVERAREALADIERREAEVRRAKEEVRRLERRRDEIAESQRELSEARARVEEARRSLSSDTDGEAGEDGAAAAAAAEDRERLESVKAAAISSAVGTLASLPISLYQVSSLAQLIVRSSAVFVSCALFGVTFRYTIRRDIDNIQLKTGTSAAFGLVKGLAAVEVGKSLELNIDSFISLSADGAANAAENIFIFLSAAVALDFCFKFSLLSPFPMRK